jgi:glycosyl transferase family 87
LPFLIAAFAALTRRHDGRAGAVIGGLAVIKPPLLLFLPYLLFRGRWRAALALIGCVAAAGVLSVLWFGPQLHRIWLTQLVGPFASRPVGAYNVQSIAGMLAHFERPEDLANWVPLEVSTAFLAVYYSLVAVVLAAAATTLLVSGPPSTVTTQWTELNIVLVLVLLVSPLTWTHYYAFCLIPLACYISRAGGVGDTAVTFAVVAGAVLVSAPVVLALPQLPVLGALFARVLVSHYVIGALLLLGALCAARRAGPRIFERHVILTAAPRPDAATASQMRIAN